MTVQRFNIIGVILGLSLLSLALATVSDWRVVGEIVVAHASTHLQIASVQLAADWRVVG